MNYSELVAKLPALAMFNDSTLNEYLETKNIYVYDESIQIAPITERKVFTQAIGVKRNKNVLKYELVYMKWGHLHTDILSSDELLQYFPNGIPCIFKPDMYSLFRATKTDTGFEFIQLNKDIAKTSDLTCANHNQKIAIKQYVASLYELY